MERGIMPDCIKLVYLYYLNLGIRPPEEVFEAIGTGDWDNPLYVIWADYRIKEMDPDAGVG